MNSDTFFSGQNSLNTGSRKTSRLSIPIFLHNLSAYFRNTFEIIGGVYYKYDKQSGGKHNLNL